MKLVGKIIISGKIKALTGLHIGGSKTALDIGGVDLNIIKTSQGIPFIPGSSLKGKLRSMLGKAEGSFAVEHDSETLKELFGDSGQDKDKGTPTRLLVRDAFAKLKDNKYEDAIFEDVELELEYSEVKWENRINRITGTAKDPRQIERVPAGATFHFELVYDVYDDVSSDNKINTAKHLEPLKKAMQLLQDDYLGGHGSRGYGKIKFEQIEVTHKKINDDNYATTNENELVTFITDLKAI